MTASPTDEQKEKPTKLYKALFVDAVKQTVAEVQYTDYREINAACGGEGFCIGWIFPESKDVLYVSDVAMLRPTMHFFWVDDRKDQPLGGSGFVVGPEKWDPEVGDLVSTDVVLSSEELAKKIRFVSRQEVDKWAADLLPGAPGGTTLNGQQVMSLRQTFANIPRPPDYTPPAGAAQPWTADDRWWTYLIIHYSDITEAIERFAPQYRLSGLWEQAWKERQVQKLVNIMQATWDAAPDERSVYRVTGFTELCNLLDGSAGEFHRE